MDAKSQPGKERMDKIRCVRCKLWLLFGRVISVIGAWENQPEWFLRLWTPLYNHCIRRSFFLDQKGRCGMWKLYDDD